MIQSGLKFLYFFSLLNIQKGESDEKVFVRRSNGV